MEQAYFRRETVSIGNKGLGCCQVHTMVNSLPPKEAIYPSFVLLRFEFAIGVHFSIFHSANRRPTMEPFSVQKSHIFESSSLAILVFQGIFGPIRPHVDLVLTTILTYFALWT